MIVSGIVKECTQYETKVQLDSNKQIIKAVSFNGLIKKDTKVLLFTDKESDSFFIVNTFKNGADEVASIIKDFLTIVKDVKIIDNSAYAPAKGLWSHDKVGDIEGLLKRIEDFIL